MNEKIVYFFNCIKTLCRKYVSFIMELIYPSYCLNCNVVLNYSMVKIDTNYYGKILFCRKCRSIIFSEHRPCPHCGGTRYPISLNAVDCPSCHTKGRWKYKRVIAMGEYEETFRNALRKIKNDKSEKLITCWTNLFLLYRGQEVKKLNADYIVSVPMFFIRRQYRGVNCPDTIARVVGKYLNVPVARGLVQRYRMVPPQVTVTVRQRYTNVKNVFRIRSPRHLFSRKPKYDIKGKTIIIVDDILTTGSTCNEVAKVLLSAGAATIYVVVLARGQGLHKNEKPNIDNKKIKPFQYM